VQKTLAAHFISVYISHMTKKFPQPILPTDPVFLAIQRQYQPASHIVNRPETLRFSQYYTNPKTGKLSIIFSQKLGENPTIIYQIERDSSHSNGPVYTLSVSAAMGTKPILEKQSSHPDPSGSDVTHLLTSMEVQVSKKYHDLYINFS
jgi:hypothetical protein